MQTSCEGYFTLLQNVMLRQLFFMVLRANDQTYGMIGRGVEEGLVNGIFASAVSHRLTTVISRLLNVKSTLLNFKISKSASLLPTLKHLVS